jgi:hypothetical protein
MKPKGLKLKSTDNNKLKVILSSIYCDRMKWSCDGSMANQMSQSLFMLTNFPYKMTSFILHANLGVDLFN